jgi:hypothetical protein
VTRKRQDHLVGAWVFASEELCRPVVVRRAQICLSGTDPVTRRATRGSEAMNALGGGAPPAQPGVVIALPNRPSGSDDLSKISGPVRRGGGGSNEYASFLNKKDMLDPLLAP